MLTQDRLKRLCNARDQLRDIGHSEQTIADAADTAAMSLYHFIRQFKAVFGETPGQFKTRERLDRAKHMLARRQQSVTDICMAVGFSSLGSFSTLFARQFGESPSTYRKRFNGSATPLQPHCMAILRGAWESESQNSRSTDKPVQAI